MEYQHDFLGPDAEAKGTKWEVMQSRVSFEEKRDITLFCKAVAKMPYSVIERLIWRRILSNYRNMPQIRHDEVTEIEHAVDEVLEYIPVIRKQRKYAPRDF